MPRYWELYNNQRYYKDVQRSTMFNPTREQTESKDNHA